MKTVFASALVAVAALTGAANAMTVSPALESDVRQYAPEADISTLSTAEINVLASLVHGGDSEGEKRAAVRAFLN